MRRTLIALALGAAIGIGLGTCASASAQPVPVTINPTKVEFDPSTSHGVVLSDGTAVLTRYELRLYYVGTTSPWNVQDLGKPAPGADGKILVTNAAWFVPATMNLEGFAKVVAIGPAGEAASESSNPFVRLGPPTPVPKPIVK